ncbi:Vitamin B12 import ATP-binding protein BtuD [Streptomyces californicus]
MTSHEPLTGPAGATGSGTSSSGAAGSADPLVEVTDLTVDFGEVRAVDRLSFTLEPGGALGVVGESGSGKSAAAYALLGLHRGTGARVGGSVLVAGTDVNAADERGLRALRGARAAMVFQDPLSSLDPYYPVGDQIAEVYRVHRPVNRRAARARAVEVLDRVGIPDAARRSRLRPHEFSGGMRQRALIAMALACEPRLLVADEPTTALDVTVQAQILDLLHDLRHETGMGLLLVTHDVGVAAESVDDVLVMRRGAEVERGPVARVLGAPREPYTKELLAAVPRLEVRRTASVSAVEGAPLVPAVEDAAPLIEAVDLRRAFGRGAGGSPPWTGSRSPCAPGRRWASSARAAAARPLWAGCWSGCSTRRRAVFATGAGRSAPCRRGSCGLSAASSRWSSRTPWPPSTPAARWGSPWPTRSGPPGNATRGASGIGWAHSWSASDWNRRTSSATRTSSAADSASASGSPAPWPPNRS